MPGQLGRYCLLEKIGEGGMGVVHLGRDAEGRAVAVKLLRPEVASDPEARRRLGREFEMMRRVHSPFVAAVIDADLAGEVPYVVTRYVAGPSLDQMVAAAGPLRGRALERLAWGLAEGLAAVHDAGVVHRDVKPGNVVIADGVPVLIDFGIAHAPDATRITQAGMFIGTPGYLAPEIVEGQPGGPPADVHSWGGTVAFAATGRPPFGTGSYEAIFYRIVTGRPDLAGVPARLLPIVTAALARDPASRPSAMRLRTECAAIDLCVPDAAEAGTIAGGGLAGGGRLRRRTRQLRAARRRQSAQDLRREQQIQAAQGLQAAQRDDSFADLLPPVRYAAGNGGAGAGFGWPAPSAAKAGAVPSGAGGAGFGWPAPSAADAGRAPGAEAPGAFQRPAPPAAKAGAVPAPSAGPSAARGAADAPAHAAFRRLLSLVTMVIAVAASVLLPVAGAAASLAVIWLLRAADLARRGLARRRSAQGARITDVPVMIIKTPWAVLRALFGCLVLAPLALVCAVATAIVTITVMHPDPLPAAGAYAAGAFVACYGFGPGSGTPRRQLGRLFGVAARRRGRATLTAVVLVVLGAATVAAAVTQPHYLWPLTPGLAWHLQALHHFVARVQVWLPRA